LLRAPKARRNRRILPSSTIRFCRFSTALATKVPLHV
jgi:hypothetical protein